MIATLDDVVEELLDVCGIYGAHDDLTCGTKLKSMYRSCAQAHLTKVIKETVRIEEILYDVRISR